MFHDIAYKAKDRQDLLAGIEEFLDEVIVLPPGEWDPDIRIEPPKSLPSSDKRYPSATYPQLKYLSVALCETVVEFGKCFSLSLLNQWGYNQTYHSLPQKRNTV